MRRVLIIGCPGSGKSTLALRLARRTGLPLIHLDQLYWRAGWKEPAKEEWLQYLDQALAGQTWIIDGNYHSTMERRLHAADTVILLDLPRRTCMWRVLRRVTISFGRTRPDMAENCPERFDLEFLLYVWEFRRKKIPADLERLRSFAGQVFILSSAREIEEFQSTLVDVQVITSKR